MCGPLFLTVAGIGFADVDSIARAGSLFVLHPKTRDDAHITSAEKASSVPGRMQTAVVKPSGAENPHVPVMKLGVVSFVTNLCRA
jgi:hypothetical protein